MQFIEAHFINRAFIASPSNIEHDALLDAGAWPRREIADPSKLLVCVNDTTKWNIYKNKTTNTFFYVKRLPWHSKLKTLTPDVHEGDFFVLCEHPSMFHSILTSDEPIHAWLNKWWQTPFLITTSIYKSSFYDSYIYSIVNGVHPPLMQELRTGRELKDMLKGHCYTIGNGLTLALAMHRVRALKQPSKSFSQSLSIFLTSHNHDNLYQQVEGAWTYLYYGHPTQHIADFPWYYVCMGPQFAHQSVVDLLLLGHDPEWFPHVVRNNQVAMTTYNSAMLPYIEPDLFDKTGISFVGIPDIYGVLNAACCTRKGWKWWNATGCEIHMPMWMDFHCVLALKSSFILYKNKSDNGRLRKRLMINIWQTMIKSYTSNVLSSLGIGNVLITAAFRFLDELIRHNATCAKYVLELTSAAQHPYYTYCLKRRVLGRLLALYRAFGLGTHKSTFEMSHVVGATILDYLQKNIDVLIQ